MRSDKFGVLFLVAMVCVAGEPADIGANNTAHYIGGGQWAWTVYISAEPDVIAHIRCVEYRLHETFPNPVRQVCTVGAEDQPFALSAQGWGEFTLNVKVALASGATATFSYDLKLIETSCARAFDSFSLKEHERHAVTNVTPPLYIYADEIHASMPSHLKVFRTTTPLPPNAGPLPIGLTKIRLGKGAALDPGTYMKIDLSPTKGRNEMAIPLGGGAAIGIGVSNASRHDYIEVRVCR